MQHHPLNLSRSLRAFSCCLIIAAFAVAVKSTSFCTQAQTYSVEEFKQTAFYAQFQEQMDSIETSKIGKVSFHYIYVVEFSSLLGEKQMVVSCPYSINDVDAIMTAGTTRWNLELDVLTLVWENDAFVGAGNSKITEPDLTVSAGQNTWLDMSGNSTHYDSDTLRKENKQTQGAYWVDVHAATIDSEMYPNEACILNVCWNGKLTIRAGMLMPWSQNIEVAADIPYQNNLR